MKKFLLITAIILMSVSACFAQGGLVAPQQVGFYNVDITGSIMSGETISAGQPVAIGNGEISSLFYSYKDLTYYDTNQAFNAGNTSMCKMAETQVAVMYSSGSDARIYFINFASNYSSTSAVTTSPNIGINGTPHYIIALNPSTILYVETNVLSKLTWSGTTLTSTPLSAGTNSDSWSSSLASAPVACATIKKISISPEVYAVAMVDHAGLIVILSIDITNNKYYYSTSNGRIAEGGAGSSSVGGAINSIKFTSGLNLVARKVFYISTYGEHNIQTIYAELFPIVGKGAYTLGVAPSGHGGTSQQNEDDFSNCNYRHSCLLTDGIRCFVTASSASSYIRAVAVRNTTNFGIAINTSGGVRIKGKVTGMSGLIAGAEYHISGDTMEVTQNSKWAFGRALSSTEFLIY